LVAPVLGTLWLSALTGRMQLTAAAQQARACYGRSLRVTGVCLGLLVASTSAAIAVVWAVQHALASTHDARLQDLASLAALSPALVAAAWLATWHDTARACVLGHDTPRSTRAALAHGYRLVTFGSVLERCASELAALSLVLLGVLSLQLTVLARLVV